MDPVIPNYVESILDIFQRPSASPRYYHIVYETDKAQSIHCAFEPIACCRCYRHNSENGGGRKAVILLPRSATATPTAIPRGYKGACVWGSRKLMTLH
jgi:hypothetical protein